MQRRYGRDTSAGFLNSSPFGEPDRLVTQTLLDVWSALAAPLRYTVRTALEQAEAPPEGAGTRPEDDGAMFDVASDIFRTQINPWVAQHGGKVELIDVQEATVVLRMTGGCHGCGMASVTLRQGIEASLRRAIPSLKGSKDITGHATGTSPYFRS